MAGKCKPLSCTCGCTIPMRVVVAILCVLAVIVCYGQRASLNIAITRIVSVSVRNLSNVCPMNNRTIIDEEIQGGTYNWSENTQGWLLQAFYVGYFIGQIPCGISADLLGGRLTLSIGLMLASALTVITPLIITYTEWYFLYVTRILLGIVQSVLYPSMSVLVAHWVPSSERATIGAFCFSSNSLGTVFGNLGTGLIISYTRYWPNTFYFWGGAGIVWCTFFLIYIYDTPQTHKHVTEKEKAFLEKEMSHYKKLKVPWKKMLSDKGILALIIGQIGHDFTFFLMMTNMPKYFSDLLNMTVQDLSLVTSIPFTGLWIIGIICGKIVDYGIKKKNWNVKWSRRVTSYISFVIPNTFLILMVYMECNIIGAALCYTIAVLLKAPWFCGFKVNHMDITVNFNGIVMSVINTSGCVGGFLSPLIVAFGAPDNTFKEWMMVMWIIWGLAAFFTTYYLLMAQAERAVWDVPADELDEFYKQRDEKRNAEEAKKKQKKEEKLAKKEAKRQAREAPT